MKKSGAKRGLLMLVLAMATVAFAQTDQASVPGDHFSLEGALELFKKSSSPDDFERLLNLPDSRVNNLDLNGDGDIDYIRVIDRQEGNVHAFILQAVISATESQDVAVISLEKLADGKAILQITGDEDIYGVETIIEPTEEVRVMAGTTTTRTVVNVWTWPSVQYVYGPYYAGYVSPWGWYVRPVWWRPWRPVAYYIYDPWWRPYRPYYAVCYSPRIVYAHHIYRPYRTTSVIVYNRHQPEITRYRASRSEHDRTRDRYDDNRGDQREGYRTRSYQEDNDSRGRSYSNENSRTNTRSYVNERSERSRTTSQPSRSPEFKRETPQRGRVETERRTYNSTPQKVEQRQPTNWGQVRTQEKKVSMPRENKPVYEQRTSQRSDPVQMKRNEPTRSSTPAPSRVSPGKVEVKKRGRD